MADTEIAVTCSHVEILTQQNLVIIFTGKLWAELAEQLMFNYQCALLTIQHILLPNYRSFRFRIGVGL